MPLPVMAIQDIHLVDCQETRRRAPYGSDQWTCDMQRKRFSLRRLGCDDMQCTPLLDCISDYGPVFSFRPKLVRICFLLLYTLASEWRKPQQQTRAR